MARIIKRIKGHLWQHVLARVPWNGQVSFSQFGEDMILSWLTRDQPRGFYVDIGAFHPIALSNTYSLYCRGWCGVNIEPRAVVFNEFESFRPRDVTLGIAVGTRGGPRHSRLFVFAKGEYSTLDESRAKALEQAGHELIEIVDVPVKTLAEVFSEYSPASGVVDFLNVDVEGLDAEVLNGNDWERFRPRLIAMERHGLSYEAVLQDDTVRFLTSVGYHIVTKCGPTLILDRLG